MAKKPDIEKWKEGPVDPALEHFELRFGPPGFAWDAGLPVARVGRPVGGVVAVAFLVDRAAPEHAAAVAAAVEEIQYFLIDKHERQPWGYAQYHCGTAANAYSNVHWSHFAAQRARKEVAMKARNRRRAAKRSIRTADWAKIMTRWLIRWVNKKGARWQVVGFEGPQKRESRGIVDLLAVRKDHGLPPPGLKRGDRLEMVLIQVKGGSAAWPTDEDACRLARVARLHSAKAVVLSEWKKQGQPDIYILRSNPRPGEGSYGWWDREEPKKVFGQSARRKVATKASRPR